MTVLRRGATLPWLLAILAAALLLALPALVHVQRAAAFSTWTFTANSMSDGRQHHTATLLQSGKVLVAGGDNEGGVLLSADLYDPGTDTWTATGDMTTARSQHTATLLP